MAKYQNIRITWVFGGEKLFKMINGTKQFIIVMIIDLTHIIKNQLSHLPPAHSSQSVAKVSPSLKFYAKYFQDIHQSLMKIRNILAQSRENYFSNASYSFQAFTDRQRVQLNETIRINLNEVSNQINELNEGLKKQASIKKKTEQEHLKAAVLCLFQFYKNIEGMFKEFQIFSIKRKRKIEETIALDKQSEKAKYKIPSIPQEKNTKINEDLEKEAQIIYVQKIREQNQLKETKVKLENLNEMMTNMSNIVLEQELKTSGFLEIGQTGLFHIEKGNKNLIQANILAQQTGKWWSLLFFSMAMSLLVLDFLKS